MHCECSAFYFISVYSSIPKNRFPYFVMNSIRLIQQIQISSIRFNSSILYIGFFHDVTIEITHLKNIFPACGIGIILDVIYLISR